MKSMKNVFILMMLMFCAGIFISCSNAKESQPAGAEKAENLFAVNTAVAVRGTLDDYLEFGGDVVASSSVDILPDTSGKLSSLYVVVGDTVRANQLIAEVDPSRPGMTYSASPVRSPISGTIISLPVSIGSTVAPSMSIGKVSNTDKLEIAMSVPERFVSRIELKQNAEVLFDAYPGVVFKATVTKISPVLDPVTRTMAVTLQLTQPDSRIKAGMFARIKLVTEQKNNAIIIPYTALITRYGESYVFAVRETNGISEAEQKKVTVGIRVDDKVEILSGISAGEMVVTKGQTLLETGSKLNIISVAGKDTAGAK